MGNTPISEAMKLEARIVAQHRYVALSGITILKPERAISSSYCMAGHILHIAGGTSCRPLQSAVELSRPTFED
jgi:hypothetical protein